jgi:MFS family permease
MAGKRSSNERPNIYTGDPPAEATDQGPFGLDPRGIPATMDLGPAAAAFGFGESPDVDAEYDASDAERMLRKERIRRFSTTPLTPETLPSSLPLAGGRGGATTDESLFKLPAFQMLWFSRLLGQIGQGALIYGLLIIVVDRTDSSFYNSLFVICSILPAIFFGLPAGVVADAMPRVPFLVGLNLLRFAFALVLVASDPRLPGLFAAALGIWTIHQFYSPTESATMAALVPRNRYVSAQALSNLALTIAQAVGLVILGPLLLKFAGPRALFAVCACCFIASAACTALLPAVNDFAGVTSERAKRASLEALLTGWRLTKRDPVMLEVLVDDILIGIGSSAIIVIIPLYLKGVLDTGAENTVFVFAPAAIGLLVGLRVAPILARSLGERFTATFGLMLFSVVVASIGLVEQIHSLMSRRGEPLIDRIANQVGIPPLVVMVMILSIPAGLSTSIVSVAARSVLMQRTPPSARGQVVATQSLLQNVGALGPTLLAGIAADLVGVEKVAIAIAFLMAFGAMALLRVMQIKPAFAPEPGWRAKTSP